ncbi:MAG: sigma-E factor negative regulatory protein [Gallionella sp.]|nr:sigma-E factor negative regulatory protein [Gallionella sp.]
MKQSISALMDGELFEDEAASCLAILGKDLEATKKWEIYHLIGDTLRQPEHIPADLSATVSAKIQQEPTVLAPRISMVRRNPRYFALSAAATLTAVGVVAWMSLQINPTVATSPTVNQQNAAFRPASMQFNQDSNEYLLAHQEFSPSTDMNGGASYIRAVAYNGEAK